MRGKKNKYHPYYVGRRSARMRVLAGIGTCLMLLAATWCIAFAVFMMLDIRTQASNERPVVPVLGARPQAPPQTQYESYKEAHYNEETAPSSVEAASWIQIIPPREDSYITEKYYIPVYLYADSPPPPIPEKYTVLSFYIHDNADLYAAFQYARPDLDTETVIWKVNVSLHMPFYSQIQVNHQPNPHLITPAYRLPPGFSPPELVSVNHDKCRHLATPATVAAFHEMRASAQEAGFELTVVSAYRSATRQKELWVRGGRRDGRVARPYHSEHQTGRALDLWESGGLLDAQGSSSTGRWVEANAYRYGFLVRYRAEITHITGYIHEPWHITYVGIGVSMYMHYNNLLSLEEFAGRNLGTAFPH